MRRSPILPVLALATFSLAALFFGCNRAKAVAEVADQVVGQPEWRLFLAEQPQGADTKAVLEDLVRREVAWQASKAMSLQDSEEWKAASARFRREILTDAYLDTISGRKAPQEADVKALYFTHGEERQVVHLVCKTEEMAKAARARIEKGEPFEQVASAVSTDSTVSRNHGNIGWIRRQAVVPEFGKAVFESKEGELCGPVQTQFGWHIAKVLAKRAPSEAEFARNKGRLLLEAKAMVNESKRKDAIPPLRATFPLTVNEPVLNTPPTLGDAPKEVGRVGGQVITVGALEAFMAQAMGEGLGGHSTGLAARRKFLELLADDYRLVAAAEKAGLAKKPEVKAVLWNTYRKAMERGVSVKYLRSLQVGEPELAAHHDQFPERFRGVGAVKVYLLVAKDDTSAERAMADAVKEVAWAKLVAKYANRESTGQWAPGFLELTALKKVLPAVAIGALQKATPGRVVGPFAGPEGPMIFRVLERRAGEIQPLAECRDQVKEDYLEAHGQELIKAYLDGAGRQGLKIRLYPANAKP